MCMGANGQMTSSEEGGHMDLPGDLFEQKTELKVFKPIIMHIRS